MIKTEIRIWLAHGPTLSEFLKNLEQEFDNIYFYMDGYSLKSILIGHLNHSNRIRNEQVMAFTCQLVDLSMLPRNSLQY